MGYKKKQAYTLLMCTSLLIYVNWEAYNNYVIKKLLNWVDLTLSIPYRDLLPCTSKLNNDNEPPSEIAVNPFSLSINHK